jgi:hypothetical protein
MNVSKVPFSLHFILCLVYNHLTKPTVPLTLPTASRAIWRRPVGPNNSVQLRAPLHGLPLMHWYSEYSHGTMSTHAACSRVQPRAPLHGFLSIATPAGLRSIVGDKGRNSSNLSSLYMCAAQRPQLRRCGSSLRRTRFG